MNPHVDVTVRGEGEATFAELLDALDSNAIHDLDVLRDVPGLSFRSADGRIVRTEDRARIEDLDTIPSPYMLGLLDPFGTAQSGAVIETNRGCPYGCTFCDWGSATLSRIRKFSLDRVAAELEWWRPSADRHRVDRRRQLRHLRARCGDRAEDRRSQANVRLPAHGRDQLREEHGQASAARSSRSSPTSRSSPKASCRSSRWTSRRSRSSDARTSSSRSTTSSSTEFRRARLPLAADIMMGLPGSTPAAFRNDLQECTDRDVRVRANQTPLLPNSPMNEPEYRREHGITAKPGEILTEAAYVHARRVGRDGPAPPRVLHLRQLGSAAVRRAVRPAGDRLAAKSISTTA